MRRVFQNEWVKYILIFVFFLCISFWMPISGDDWNNYLVGSKGLHHMLGQAIGMYFDWEGRFVSRILINFLTYYKFLFNLLLSFLITLGVYVIVHLRKVKHKSFLFLFSFGIIIFLDNPLFTQTVLWVAGSITYLFPSILIFLYFSFYLHYLKGKEQYPKWSIFILSLVSFSIPMFVENIGCSFVLLNLILVLYERIIYKRWNRILLFIFFLSLISLMLMLFSPGSAKRSIFENSESISLFKQFVSNIDSFVKYTLANNFYLILLMIFSSCLLSLRIYSRWIIRIVSILFLVVVPVLLLWSVGFPEWICHILWLSFLFYSLFLVFNYYRKDHEMFFLLLVLLVVGLFSNIVMMFTPAISSRTSLFWVLCGSVSFLYVIDDLVIHKIPKIVYYIGCSILVLICSSFLIAYYNMHRFSKFLDASIKQELNAGSSVITIYEAPSYLSWGLLPTGDYHTRTFKEYYGISLSQELNVRKSVWNLYLFFDLEQTQQIK